LKSSLKILVYGYGNPGRQDDALGVMLAQRVEEWIKRKKLGGITVDTNYQLNIEDATLVAEHDVVIFTDASMEKQVNDFVVSQVKPNNKTSFTMHAVNPGFILDICRKMYKRTPETFLIHIRGYEWELKEGVTAAATKNLEKATRYVKNALLYPDLLTIKDYFKDKRN
jgi:hydrogenase maturation protease